PRPDGFLVATSSGEPTIDDYAQISSAASTGLIGWGQWRPVEHKQLNRNLQLDVVEAHERGHRGAKGPLDQIDQLLAHCLLARLPEALNLIRLPGGDQVPLRLRQRLLEDDRQRVLIGEIRANLARTATAVFAEQLNGPGRDSGVRCIRFVMPLLRHHTSRLL